MTQREGKRGRYKRKRLSMSDSIERRVWSHCKLQDIFIVLCQGRLPISLLPIHLSLILNPCLSQFIFLPSESLPSVKWRMASNRRKEGKFSLCYYFKNRDETGRERGQFSCLRLAARLMASLGLQH